MLVLIYLLALLGSFYLGLVWRDYAIPFLWDRGYRALAVALPGTVGAIALLVMR